MQSQSLFAHLLSNIVGVLYRKVSKEQKSMSEEYLKNTIILDIVSSIDIFINHQLVTDIKIRNQVIHLYTNVGYKTNQMKAMVPEYGKLW